MEDEKWVGVNTPPPTTPATQEDPDVPELIQLERDYLEAIEQNRPQCIINARECLLLEAQYREAAKHDWTWKLRKAVLLSPTVDICEALLRGEQVPVELLNQDGLRRFGRRRQP